MFDANTGTLKHTYLPSGQRAGDTITEWLFALHMAQVWGIPMQIFVCLMGLVVAMLSVTGVVIWWRKRAARIDAISRKEKSPMNSAPNRISETLKQ